MASPSHAFLLVRPILGFDDTAIVLFLIVVGVFACLLIPHYIKAYWRSQARMFRRFFGPDVKNLSVHEKDFPGYDLPSLVHAIKSIETECCHPVISGKGIGSRSLLMLFETIRHGQRVFGSNPVPIPFVRCAIDLGVEASLPTNRLTFARLRSGQSSAADAGGTGFERVAIYFASSHRGSSAAVEIPGDEGPGAELRVAIACRSAEIADWFFAQVETRRRQLCVFRGKFIEPSVRPGAIDKITFRPLKPIGADQLVLPDSVMSQVETCVVRFYNHAERLRRVGVEMKRCILFHGPPGVGKTSICLHLARSLPQFTVCFVSGQQLLFPREICRMARYLQPTMLVFEDIDLIAEHRDANSLATVLGELMNQIDGCDPDDRVVFVMNTNSLDRLESAVRNRPGRVDQIIELPLPDGRHRQQLIELFSRQMRLDVSDMSRVIAATIGVTPAALKEIVKRAAVYALDSSKGASDGQPIVLREADLLLATEQVRSFRGAIEPKSRAGFRSEDRAD